MRAPVWGLRPSWGPLCLTSNVPHPISPTESPLASAPWMISSAAFQAEPESFLVQPVFSATEPMTFGWVSLPCPLS